MGLLAAATAGEAEPQTAGSQIDLQCLHWIHSSPLIVGAMVRVETEIKKWGNSLALRVTGVMAELPQFEPGTRVTVDIDSEGFVVRRAAGSLRSFRFPQSESTLLRA